MIQVIGLIIVTYAIIRLCQVPLEHKGCAFKGVYPIVLALSGTGLLILVILTLLLLFLGMGVPSELGGV